MWMIIFISAPIAKMSYDFQGPWGKQLAADFYIMILVYKNHLSGVLHLFLQVKAKQAHEPYLD